jgi:hypothetical protein
MPIRKWMLVLGAVLTLAACGTDRATDTNAPPAASDITPLSPPVSPAAQYRTAVEDRVAAVLHTTASQLRSQLAADRRLTLMNLAKPAGLSQDKLAAAILSALTDSADAAARAGVWTVEQAGQEKQYWTAQPDLNLITEISRWFRDD